jgi:excisionase family DNA binding protein
MPRAIRDWITLAEAAAIFAEANIPISTSTLARWARTGRLRSVQPGRRVYVSRAQVRSLLRPRRRGVPLEELSPGFFDDLQR